MYKLTIEEVVGDVRKVTTLETEDVELVKLILEVGNVESIDSDVANKNIDPEWQELWQWYLKKKDTEKFDWERVLEIMKQVQPQINRQEILPRPLNPFTDQYPGIRGPFEVTC